MTQWNRYESEVKGLLDWITEEANTFSKKVTTKGDEGVEDYIEACKVRDIFDRVSVVKLIIQGMLSHAVRIGYHST